MWMRYFHCTPIPPPTQTYTHTFLYPLTNTHTHIYIYNIHKQINADQDTVITYMTQKIGGGEDFFQSVVVKGVMDAITGA